MGSGESHGALHVEVDTPNHQAGDTITGSVHLLAKQPISASSISLFLKGTEKTQWSTKHKTGKFTYYTRHSGKHSIIRQRFNVYSFPHSEIEPGHYSFPFSIESPADMVSSFFYTPPYFPLLDDGRVLATIKYKLVAKVDNPQARITKGAACLHITRPVPESFSPYSDEKVAVISTWCCCAKGIVRVRATFDKTTYIPGESATVTVDVTNAESKLKVTAYKLELSRVIRMRSAGGSLHTVSNTINKTQVKTCVLPGSDDSATAKQLQLMIPSEKDVEMMTSVSGRLIECVYTLRAEAEMDGSCMCCGDSPSVSKGMTIYPPPVERAEVPAVEEWNPRVMPARQFSVGPESAYERQGGVTEVALE